MSRPAASKPLRLQHIHIPGFTNRLPSYALAVAIQSKLQQRLLDYKAAVAAAATEGDARPLPPPPPPTILSFTPAPTYTLGRRQTTPLSPDEAALLQGRLDIYWHKHYKTHKRLNIGDEANQISEGRTADHGHNHACFYPAIHNAPRGGLTTYHGPGQVVFWPVLDLKSPLHRHFSVRDYACLLEKTTIASIAEAASASLPSFPPDAVRQKQVQGFTTENPGVWVRRHWVDGDDEADGHPGPEGEERKIAALGVHLRRHVTGLGVAVNCSMPVRGVRAYNPWERIVACGLEGKRVTSLAYELLEYMQQVRWIRALAPQPLLGDHWKGQKKRPEAPVLETQMLRAWPEFFARALRMQPDGEGEGEGAAVLDEADSSASTTKMRDDLVDDVTIEDVLGKGWEHTIDLPEKEQYTTALRKRVLGTLPVETAYRRNKLSPTCTTGETVPYPGS
ncbi:octanoyltransferase [Apiospora marii]|uniref:Octanoyltransferase n=1 Tax=Apiospora marii TaxID=335849 RepID=A0ABR1RCS3_9PEZI